MRRCEMCRARATCYGGFAGADAWAGWVCDGCAERAPGFAVWDRLEVAPMAALAAAQVAQAKRLGYRDAATRYDPSD